MSKNENCDPVTAMKVLKVIGFVILGVAACFAFGLVIQLLWNWLMPKLFGLPDVTYWEGIGLLILSSILFGRIGGGSDGHKDKKKKGSHPIRDEIKKEIAKEFEKEYGKKANGDSKSEQLYEKWWDEQGRESFEKYSEENEE